MLYNPKEAIVNGENAYRYINNPYYYITKSGILYSTYIKGGQGAYSINCIRKVAYGEDSDGYYRVILSLHGNRTYVKIHQIVANQFLGECPDGLVINHKDGNKHNNNVSNLEFVTNLENIRHAWESGLNSKELNPNRVSVNIYDHKTNQTHHFSSIANACDFLENIPITYLRRIKNNEILFIDCLFKKIKTGTKNTAYHIECYHNGMIFKTFDNNEQAAQYFNKSKNNVSHMFKHDASKVKNRYTITFPNVSTTENIAV